MNAVAPLLQHITGAPNRLALWTADDGALSYAEFGELAARAQAVADDCRLRTGEPVLLLAQPSAALFAAVVGLVAAGIPVLFVEPWLPVGEIEDVVRLVRPQAFWTGLPGRIWGARVGAVRGIPQWTSLSSVQRRGARGLLRVEHVDGDAPAMLTFTSGTTGRPKGILRTHGYLRATQNILATTLARDVSDGPDLSVFPNFALLNLAGGRGAVVVPADWSGRALRRVAALPPALQPRTLTCGPAFLGELLTLSSRGTTFHSLESIHVGGALTDCSHFERAFAEWPGARWIHLYGSTEVEPVAVADARVAVQKSRERGFYQTLFCGAPIPELECAPSPDGLWVTGLSVAVPFGGPAAGARGGFDEGGRYWHCTGDRVAPDNEGWWFGGRATQLSGEFQLEQQLYAHLRTSACFVQRDARGQLWLYGEGLDARRTAVAALRCAFPGLAGVRPARIVRDRRHRARIDRALTLARSGYHAR